MIYILILILLSSLVFPQVIDDFSDGEITSSPAWSGDVSSWIVVDNSSSGPNETGSMTLRLNAPNDGSTSQYLSVNPGSDWNGTIVWGAWVGRRSSSSYTESNGIRYYLWSNSSNLESDTLDAYRVVIGDNSGDDEIILQRVDDGTPVDILAGSDPIVNGTGDISILIRVFRSMSGEFSLYTSDIPVAGEGPSPFLTPTASNTPLYQGSATDITYGVSNGGYTGFLAKHTSGTTSRTAVEIDQVYFETNSDQSLPVFISSFTARQDGELAYLSWVTESEINNLGFEIFRQSSETGSTLISSYRYNTQLSGSGSTTKRTCYSYSDGPLEPGHEYTYSLFQADHDGAINRVASTSLYLEEPFQPQVSAYPNPSMGKVSITVRNPGFAGKLTLYNLLGQEINKSEYSYTVSGKRADIRLGPGLPGGYYIASYTDGSRRNSVRFLYMP